MEKTLAIYRSTLIRNNVGINKEPNSFINNSNNTNANINNNNMNNNTAYFNDPNKSQSNFTFIHNNNNIIRNKNDNVNKSSFTLLNNNNTANKIENMIKNNNSQVNNNNSKNNFSIMTMPIPIEASYKFEEIEFTPRTLATQYQGLREVFIYTKANQNLILNQEITEYTEEEKALFIYNQNTFTNYNNNNTFVIKTINEAVSCVIIAHIKKYINYLQYKQNNSIYNNETKINNDDYTNFFKNSKSDNYTEINIGCLLISNMYFEDIVISCIFNEDECSNQYIPKLILYFLFCSYHNFNINTAEIEVCYNDFLNMNSINTVQTVNTINTVNTQSLSKSTSTNQKANENSNSNQNNNTMSKLNINSNSIFQSNYSNINNTNMNNSNNNNNLTKSLNNTNANAVIRESRNSANSDMVRNAKNKPKKLSKTSQNNKENNNNNNNNNSNNSNNNFCPLLSASSKYSLYSKDFSYNANNKSRNTNKEVLENNTIIKTNNRKNYRSFNLNSSNLKLEKKKKSSYSPTKTRKKELSNNKIISNNEMINLNSLDNRKMSTDNNNDLNTNTFEFSNFNSQIMQKNTIDKSFYGNDKLKAKTFKSKLKLNSIIMNTADGEDRKKYQFNFSNKNNIQLKSILTFKVPSKSNDKYNFKNSISKLMNATSNYSKRKSISLIEKKNSNSFSNIENTISKINNNMMINENSDKAINNNKIISNISLISVKDSKVVFSSNKDDNDCSNCNIYTNVNRNNVAQDNAMNVKFNSKVVNNNNVNRNYNDNNDINKNYDNYNHHPLTLLPVNNEYSNYHLKQRNKSQQQERRYDINNMGIENDSNKPVVGKQLINRTLKFNLKNKSIFDANGTFQQNNIYNRCNSSVPSNHYKSSFFLQNNYNNQTLKNANTSNNNASTNPVSNINPHLIETYNLQLILYKNFFIKGIIKHLFDSLIYNINLTYPELRSEYKYYGYLLINIFNEEVIFSLNNIKANPFNYNNYNLKDDLLQEILFQVKQLKSIYIENFSFKSYTKTSDFNFIKRIDLISTYPKKIIFVKFLPLLQGLCSVHIYYRNKITYNFKHNKTDNPASSFSDMDDSSIRNIVNFPHLYVPKSKFSRFKGKKDFAYETKIMTGALVREKQNETYMEPYKIVKLENFFYEFFKLKGNNNEGWFYEQKKNNENKESSNILYINRNFVSFIGLAISTFHIETINNNSKINKYKNSQSKINYSVNSQINNSNSNYSNSLLFKNYINNSPISGFRQNTSNINANIVENNINTPLLSNINANAKFINNNNSHVTFNQPYADVNNPTFNLNYTPYNNTNNTNTNKNANNNLSTHYLTGNNYNQSPINYNTNHLITNTANNNIINNNINSNTNHNLNTNPNTFKFQCTNNNSYNTNVTPTLSHVAQKQSLLRFPNSTANQIRLMEMANPIQNYSEDRILIIQTYIYVFNALNQLYEQKKYSKDLNLYNININNNSISEYKEDFYLLHFDNMLVLSFGVINNTKPLKQYLSVLNLLNSYFKTPSISINSVKTINLNQPSIVYNNYYRISNNKNSNSNNNDVNNSKVISFFNEVNEDSYFKNDLSPITKANDSSNMIFNKISPLNTNTTSNYLIRNNFNNTNTITNKSKNNDFLPIRNMKTFTSNNFNNNLNNFNNSNLNINRNSSNYTPSINTNSNNNGNYSSNLNLEMDSKEFNNRFDAGIFSKMSSNIGSKSNVFKKMRTTNTNMNTFKSFRSNKKNTTSTIQYNKTILSENSFSRVFNEEDTPQLNKDNNSSIQIINNKLTDNKPNDFYTINSVNYNSMSSFNKFKSLNTNNNSSNNMITIATLKNKNTENTYSSNIISNDLKRNSLQGFSGKFKQISNNNSNSNSNSNIADSKYNKDNKENKFLNERKKTHHTATNPTYKIKSIFNNNVHNQHSLVLLENNPENNINSSVKNINNNNYFSNFSIMKINQADLNSSNNNNISNKMINSELIKGKSINTSVNRKNMNSSQSTITVKKKLSNISVLNNIFTAGENLLKKISSKINLNSNRDRDRDKNKQTKTSYTEKKDSNKENNKLTRSISNLNISNNSHIKDSVSSNISNNSKKIKHIINNRFVKKIDSDYGKGANNISNSNNINIKSCDKNISNIDINNIVNYDNSNFELLQRNAEIDSKLKTLNYVNSNSNTQSKQERSNKFEFNLNSNSKNNSVNKTRSNKKKQSKIIEEKENIIYDNNESKRIGIFNTNFKSINKIKNNIPFDYSSNHRNESNNYILNKLNKY